MSDKRLTPIEVIDEELKRKPVSFENLLDGEYFIWSTHKDQHQDEYCRKVKHDEDEYCLHVATGELSIWDDLNIDGDYDKSWFIIRCTAEVKMIKKRIGFYE